jgi:hypothetical protein
MEGVELKCVLNCVEHVFVLEGLICNKLSDRLGNIAPYRMRNRGVLSWCGASRFQRTGSTPSPSTSSHGPRTSQDLRTQSVLEVSEDESRWDVRGASRGQTTQDPSDKTPAYNEACPQSFPGPVSSYMCPQVLFLCSAAYSGNLGSEHTFRLGSPSSKA